MSGPDPQPSSDAARRVFMFSGQGSQYFQMGRTLYEDGGGFARWMRHMHCIVRDLGGPAVLDLIYGDRSKAVPFDDLRASHPAIFMVEFALAQCLLERGVEPDLTLGVSLGTVAAAVFAGSLDMEDALTWVVRQSAYVAEHAARGGMFAVLSPPALQLVPALHERCVIAAHNGPAHWVLSACEEDLAPIEAELKARGVSFAALPVRYPFHSPWLLPDEAVAAALVPAPPLRTARLPLVCCAAGGPLRRLPPQHLWQAALAPIRFDRAVAAVEADGAPCHYIDLGPSGTLATLLQHLLPAGAAARVQRVLSPYGGERAALDTLVVSAAMPGAATHP
jgi:bacillaene synthase trans-acting acyltransferase